MKQANIFKFDLVCRLTEGSIFGELALIYNQPRLATVISMTESSMCLLDRKSFKNSLGKIQRKRDREKIEFIGKNIIGEEYSSVAHTVGINFTKKVIKKGDHLFIQGELPEKIFIIFTGQIRLWATGHSGVGSETKSAFEDTCPPMMIKKKNTSNIRELAIVASGEMVGEESLFTGDLRQYNATADVETLVYEINNERFLVVCENNRLVKQMMLNLIDRKKSIIKILEDRAARSKKKFSLFSDGLKKRKLIERQNAEPEASVTKETSRVIDTQRFTNLVSRTKLSSSINISELRARLNQKNEAIAELEDIDKVIVGMKQSNKEKEKAIKKSRDFSTLFSRSHRKTYSDHQQAILKALNKKSSEASMASQISVENSHMINIVNSYHPLSFDDSKNRQNLKKSCSIVFPKNPVEVYPSLHSRHLSEARLKLQKSKLHFRSSSLAHSERDLLPSPLITQVPVSERETPGETRMLNIKGLHTMSMIRLSNLKNT